MAEDVPVFKSREKIAEYIELLGQNGLKGREIQVLVALKDLDTGNLDERIMREKGEEMHPRAQLKQDLSFKIRGKNITIVEYQHRNIEKYIKKAWEFIFNGKLDPGDEGPKFARYLKGLGANVSECRLGVYELNLYSLFSNIISSKTFTDTDRFYKSLEKTPKADIVLCLDYDQYQRRSTIDTKTAGEILQHISKQVKQPGGYTIFSGKRRNITESQMMNAGFTILHYFDKCEGSSPMDEIPQGYSTLAVLQKSPPSSPDPSKGDTSRIPEKYKPINST